MLAFREHGASGPLVIALHGGPGAAGSAAPLARGLADEFRVLEPFQRGSGGEPLTVARHIEDLKTLIDHHCVEARPALVGHSWGAMLALAFAAAHPRAAGPIVLVGCGTFDTTSRAHMSANLNRRIPDALRSRIDLLPREIPDPDTRLATLARLLLENYSHRPVSADLGDVRCDARSHDETWSDMLLLQERRVYPQAFAAIESPVLMLHGDVDPHPGEMIRDALAGYIPTLEYQELPDCGHYPWNEALAATTFFRTLRSWLHRKTGT